MEQEKDADKTTPDGIVTDDYPVEVLVVSRAMARVVIGNSLTQKYQREMYTPFWYRVTSTRWPMYR